MRVGQARAVIRRMRGRWRLRIWIALAVALGVGLGWVPLFGVLGFELATAVALFAAGMGVGRGGGGGPAEYAGGRMVRTTVAAVGLAVTVTVIPGAIAAIRGIW